MLCWHDMHKNWILSLGQWFAEQRQLKEQYILIEHGICLFAAEQGDVNIFYSSQRENTDGLRNKAGSFQCCPWRNSSLLLLVSIFWWFGHRKWAALSTAVQHHAAACDRRDLSLQPHTVITLLSVSPTIPKLIAKLASSALSFHDHLLTPHICGPSDKLADGCRLECAQM